MRKKFVKEYKWIKDSLMLDLIAIAQSSPGAIAVNAAIIIGYRLNGLIGATVAAIATVLPPLLILSIVSLFYLTFRDNIVVNVIMKGMQTGVAAVIIDVVITMVSQIFMMKKKIPILMIIFVFIATYFFKINIIFIIIICGILGALYNTSKRRK